MASSSLVELPFTWWGRLWGTASASAPSVMTSSAPVLRTISTRSSLKHRQRRWGSTPAMSSRSWGADGASADGSPPASGSGPVSSPPARAGCGPGRPAHVLGPDDDALAVLHLHQGPAGREVEVRLGVDGGQRRRLELVDQPLDGAGRGPGHVEPTLEGHHQDRVAQARVRRCLPLDGHADQPRVCRAGRAPARTSLGRPAGREPGQPADARPGGASAIQVRPGWSPISWPLPSW